MIHELKTWPVPYGAATAGEKTYDIRRADRRYRTGDVLVMREFMPPEDPTEEGYYTGNFSIWQVSHITEGGAWGIPAHLVVMGIKPVGLSVVRSGSNLDRVVARLKAFGREQDGKVPEVLSFEDEPCPGCPGCAAEAADEAGEPGLPPGDRYRFN